MILAAAFVPTGQPEMSQTQGVWFTIHDEISPEGAAESIVLSGRVNLACALTSHFVAG
jgi:hypothetical protein